ncbi:hypothetical protein BGZ80_010307 [Entomortierella chlamydospora]|uniref:UBX domain-containing protein n=1 Tax=Entomortierella chlamydospora TaxID=101097 RepID=A0A9P6MV86_9FUNG|nr:hypothetical protein BGZ80_010307 [Entomortierella chlamydospora]
MTDSGETASLNIWFGGSVAAAVEMANTKGSVLLVCLIQDSTEGSESALFERRFAEERVASELSGLNLVSLRLVRDSADGLMFSQIFPALYLIRNGLLADFMNSSVGVDLMLERIKKAVDGHFEIPPPPNAQLPEVSSTPNHSNSTPSDITPIQSSNPDTAPQSTGAAPPATMATSSTSRTTANPSNANGHPVPDRSQDLKELMKERKLKREKEEREAVKQREIDRRSSSKVLTEAQRELAEKQSKKLKDQIEKEKRDEAEYRKKVKQALEEDKARRKAERETARAAAAAAAAVTSGGPVSGEILTPAEIRSQNAGLMQARNDAGPSLAYDSSRLNIRLFDGSSIRNTFKATDTLERVREWINQNLDESEYAYNIVQLIPPRTFTDESKLLRDLELCPSATLVLKKTPTASSAYGAGDGAAPTLLSYGWSALSLAGKIASGAYSTVSYYNPLAGNNSAGSSSNDRSIGPSSSSNAAS